MIVFQQATAQQKATAVTLCQIFNEMVPRVPSQVQAATDGPYQLLLLRFSHPGVMVIALFFQSADSKKAQIAELRLYIQPLSATFRLVTHAVSYEELGEVLRGTPIQALDTPTLREFINLPMNSDLREFFDRGYLELMPRGAA